MKTLKYVCDHGVKGFPPDFRISKSYRGWFESSMLCPTCYATQNPPLIYVELYGRHMAIFTKNCFKIKDEIIDALERFGGRTNLKYDGARKGWLSVFCEKTSPEELCGCTHLKSHRAKAAKIYELLSPLGISVRDDDLTNLIFNPKG